MSSGWLHAVSVGLSPSGPLHVELNAGLRKNTNPLDTPATTSVTWYGLDMDLNLSRSWFLLMSASRETGVEGNTQIYGGISYRF